MYRVLLVDEDPHIQTANEVFLREMGYQIYRADHGAAALDVASTVVVDAVVLDAELPNLDGVPICRQLRERYQVPIIFLSRHTRADNPIRDILTAGDDSLEKPYSLCTLALQRMLRYNNLRLDKGVYLDGSSGCRGSTAGTAIHHSGF